MTRLCRYTLLMLAGYSLLACTIQPHTQQNTDIRPPPALKAYVPIKVVPPEAWQCFQALDEIQWHCQKDTHSPLVLSLTDIALEKDRVNTPISTFAIQPSEQFNVHSDKENGSDILPSLPPKSFDNTSSEVLSHQNIPMHVSGRLHNARDEVLKLPAHFYTLQLLAVKDKQKLINFVQNNDILQPIYLSVANQEIEFHILLAGIYENFETAADQSATLEGHTQIQPWVRQLGALQNALMNTPEQLRVSTVP